MIAAIVCAVDEILRIVFDGIQHSYEKQQRLATRRTMTTCVPDSLTIVVQ